MSSFSSPRHVRLVLFLVVLSIVAVALPLLGGAATLQLPTGVSKTQAYTMYAEQLDSQSAIDDLVAGDITQFIVTKRSVTASSAALTLDVRYANGLRRRGTMRLFKAGTTWYFASISHQVDGNDHVGAVSTADVGVVNTILAEQTENSAISENFVNGAYKKVLIGTPKPGFNAVELPVTFAGGTRSAGEKGRVTCITKTLGGEQVWFITGFAK